MIPPVSLFSLFPNSERIQYIVQDDLLFWKKADGLMKCWFGKREVFILSCSSKEISPQCPWEYMIQMCFNHSPIPKTLHCFCLCGDFELKNTKCTWLEGTFGKDYIFKLTVKKRPNCRPILTLFKEQLKTNSCLWVPKDRKYTHCLPSCAAGRCRTYIWYRRLGLDMHLCLLWKRV